MGQSWTKARPTMRVGCRWSRSSGCRARNPGVAHHEHVTLGDHLGDHVAGFDPRLQVGLLQRDAVDVEGTVALLDGLAGQCHHPLDEVLDPVVGLVGRPLEHHEVAPVHVVELVAELVHEDAVVLGQGREHRLGGDVERLDQERLDHQGHGKGTDHDGNPLDGVAQLAQLVPVPVVGRGDQIGLCHHRGRLPAAVADPG